MSSQIKLVKNIFTELNKTGVLDELVLTGSWCQYVYKRSEEYRYMMQQASTITTMDIDFTIPDKNKVKTEADVPAILKGIGFTEEIKRNGLVKFGNPDIELEFLTKLTGRGDESIVKIEKLKLNATPLRYINVLSDNAIKVNFEGIEIKVPDPATFVLIKFLVSEKRNKPEKREKDIQTAKELLNILLSEDKQRENFKKVYNDFLEGWKKSIRKIFLKNGIDIKNLNKGY